MGSARVYSYPIGINVEGVFYGLLDVTSGSVQPLLSDGSIWSVQSCSIASQVARFHCNRSDVASPCSSRLLNSVRTRLRRWCASSSSPTECGSQT